MRSGNVSSRSSVLSAAFAIAVLLLSFLCASALAQTVTTLQNFNGGNGANPFLGALTQGRDGKLYGTTYNGGANGIGTIFRFNQATNYISVMHSFAGADGSSPAGGVTLATDGNFYGTTNYGGSAGFGVLFRITPSGVYTVLHSFLGESDGEYPDSAPIEASDGNLYGVTTGGFNGDGSAVDPTVYKYTRTGVYSIVYTFAATDGANVAMMMQGSDGMLYATANTGGSDACGSIVKLTLAGVLKGVHSFNCQHDSGGAYPFAALVEASNGNYYGTTPDGGVNDFGVLFELSPTFAETVGYTFTSAGARTPQAGLVQGTDGNLYGVTQSSGNLEGGILYNWNPSTLAYSQLYQFIGTSYLSAPLMQHTSGFFYAPSWQSGTYNDGYLFSVDMGLGPFVAFVYPGGGVGVSAQILGQGLTGATAVTFNGVAATSFTVVTDTYMTALVPSGATTGPVVVTTPGGTLTSNVNFRVSP
ncbi:MAG: choice-of-anchor tandem repeat GloVer-containing protein [Candidatus Sulfotelmatobacter sp.]